MYMIVSR